jgi:hypothetical protein
MSKPRASANVLISRAECPVYRTVSGWPDTGVSGVPDSGKRCWRARARPWWPRSGAGYEEAVSLVSRLAVSWASARSSAGT